MAQIGNNIFISGLSGKLIIRWVKASDPLTEVGRNDNPSTLTFPVDMVYTIPNLMPVVYIVQFWRSDDGIALDQLIKDWSIDASQETQIAVRTYQYKVDRGFNNVNQSTGDEVWADPENEDVILVDERLDGYAKTDLIVHEAGYGHHLDAEYDLFAGGGIELLGGKTFDTDVAWFITASSTTVSQVPNNTVVGQMFAGVEHITTDMNFFTSSSNNLYNKLCIVNGGGNKIQVTFPDLATIPDDTHVTFTTQKGTQYYLILQFDAGDVVRFGNQNLNVIDIAKCEKISLYFYGGECHVISYSGNAMRRGQIAYLYDADVDTEKRSYLYAHEDTGEILESDMPGLYRFVEQLTGDAVCEFGTGVGQWSYELAGVFPNKCKWGIKTTVPKKFRVPHLVGLVAKMSSTPGVYEADQVGEINQDIAFKQGASDDNESGVTLKYLREIDATGGTGYSNLSVNFLFNSGDENRVKSYSQKPFVIL